MQGRVGPGNLEQGILLGLRDFSDKVERNNVVICYGCMPNCEYRLKVYEGTESIKITKSVKIEETMQDVLGRNQGRTIHVIHSGHEGIQIQKKMLFKRVQFVTTSSAEEAVLDHDSKPDIYCREFSLDC